MLSLPLLFVCPPLLSLLCCAPPSHCSSSSSRTRVARVSLVWHATRMHATLARAAVHVCASVPNYTVHNMRRPRRMRAASRATRERGAACGLGPMGADLAIGGQNLYRCTILSSHAHHEFEWQIKLQRQVDSNQEMGRSLDIYQCR